MVVCLTQGMTKTRRSEGRSCLLLVVRCGWLYDAVLMTPVCVALTTGAWTGPRHRVELEPGGTSGEGRRSTSFCD